MSDNNSDTPPTTPAGEWGSRGDTAMSSAIAASLIEVYKARNLLLGADLFHAPAWEILLLLEPAGPGLSEGALREVLNFPLPSLRRWLDVLVSRALIVPRPNAAGRETYHLTDRARTDLREVLLAVARKPDR